MKTLASLLVVTATFLGANAYAQEPPSVLEYRPIISQISSVTRVQIVREIQAVKASGQVSFNEFGQPIADVAGGTIALEVIRLETITVDVTDAYPSRDASHNIAFSGADRVMRSDAEEPATKTAVDEVTDETVVAEASGVDLIGLYSYGDQSYKTAFSVVHAPRG